MKRKLLRATRRLFLGGCLMVVPGFLQQTAFAELEFATVTTYYSNSAHTTVVGTRTITCFAKVFMTGTMSEFFTVQQFKC